MTSNRDNIFAPWHILREDIMPEVPAKLYLDKLLKDCRKTARALRLLSGPVKEKTLRAMADRLAADEEKILSANEKDRIESMSG